MVNTWGVLLLLLFALYWAPGVEAQNMQRVMMVRGGQPHSGQVFYIVPSGQGTSYRSHAPPPPARKAAVKPATQSSQVTYKPVSLDDPRVPLLSMEMCGLSSTDRIVNGFAATPGQFCWIALLRYGQGPESQYPKSAGCGGALISRDWVLTAAHCLVNLPSTMKLVEVVMGEHDRSTDPDECDKYGKNCLPKAIRCGVKRIIVHYAYDALKQINDIALVQLDRLIDIGASDMVCTVCLPLGAKQFTEIASGNVAVAGWGLNENYEASTRLMWASLPVMNQTQCQKSGSIATPHPCLLCAGGGKQDSCNGDSGGPVGRPEMVELRSSDGERWSEMRVMLRGVVSYGPADCATPGKASINTLVGCFVDWILQEIAKVATG